MKVKTSIVKTGFKRHAIEVMLFEHFGWEFANAAMKQIIGEEVNEFELTRKLGEVTIVHDVVIVCTHINSKYIRVEFCES